MFEKTNFTVSTVKHTLDQAMNLNQFTQMTCSQFPCTFIYPNQTQNNNMNKISNQNNNQNMTNQQFLIQNNFCVPEYTYNQAHIQNTSQNHSNLPQKSKISKPHPKTKFSNQEDLKLLELVKKYGTNNWYQISNEMNGRNIRQCRERYRNYLTPEVVNGPWTKEEDDLLFETFTKYGARWKLIASFFPTRTDINIKNRWQVHFRRYIRQTKNILKKRNNNQQNLRFNNNFTNINNATNNINYINYYTISKEKANENNNHDSLHITPQQSINCAALPVPSISNERIDSSKISNSHMVSDKNEILQNKQFNSARKTYNNDESKNLRNEFDDLFDDFVDTSFFDPSMNIYDALRFFEGGM